MPLPSVLLHDHLDGGLRPETVLALADLQGYGGLPFRDPGQLARWFDQSESGTLETYLRAFGHTIAVMQTRDAIERVAYEAAIDLSNDGVVYAEVRFCPLLHVEAGLRQRDVIEAVSEGMGRGAAETGLEWGLIIDSLRHIHDSLALARLAVESTDIGVVGFDLAGPEAGHPPERHVEAFLYARANGLRVTLHAGEAAGGAGVSHIRSSMNTCGAERIGHGVELIDDCVVKDGVIVEVGPVADQVRARRIALEMCPTSNLATKPMPPEDHPVGAFYRAGFTIALGTDNRLMSATSMSREFAFVQKYHGFSTSDLFKVTRDALDAAFCSWGTKKRLWETRIAPAYRSDGVTVDERWS